MVSDNSTWTPETVLSTLPYRPEENSTSPVPFFHLIERLKTTKREGWRRFGINNGESISDHMYRMSIMTMMAPPSLAEKINIPRCIKMALIHDMAEALVGDITPVDPVTKPEKARREASVMDYITTTLLGKVPGGALSGGEIKEIFEEYEANESDEAKFVHDIDKMELLLQMVEYERLHKVDLTEFTHVKNRIQLEPIQKWADEVILGRPNKA
ncbi:HD family hydrolase [Penicillium cf. viridicatum]|uniref:5'-deoxynucleotidase n=1 Tax=Penicillium cf. viridicatum TaxID=2972119 RepID=A0A9W9MH05_9EURO|nr:HD family hydrolase [Penicillium cf. viridicatum]